MNNKEQKKSIKSTVLNKIKSGQVKMKPKTYFVLRAVLIALIAFIIILFALYLVSFIIFALRATGLWSLPKFGFPGMKLLFTSLPWILILTAIFLILILEIFTRRFTLAYRRPILYSVLIIIIFVVLGGFIVYQTKFHSNLFSRAQQEGLPIMGRFYRDYNIDKLQNMHYGIVSEITDNGFFIEKSNQQILTVIIIPETRFPFEKEIKEGEAIMVLGEENNGIIQAFGIKKNNNGLRTFPKNNMLLPK